MVRGVQSSQKHDCVYHELKLLMKKIICNVSPLKFPKITLLFFIIIIFWKCILATFELVVDRNVYLLMNVG